MKQILPWKLPLNQGTHTAYLYGIHHLARRDKRAFAFSKLYLQCLQAEFQTLHPSHLIVYEHGLYNWVRKNKCIPRSPYWFEMKDHTLLKKKKYGGSWWNYYQFALQFFKDSLCTNELGLITPPHIRNLYGAETSIQDYYSLPPRVRTDFCEAHMEDKVSWYSIHRSIYMAGFISGLSTRFNQNVCVIVVDAHVADMDFILREGNFTDTVWWKAGYFDATTCSKQTFIKHFLRNVAIFCAGGMIGVFIMFLIIG
jgi:hypothetical protein